MASPSSAIENNQSSCEQHSRHQVDRTMNEMMIIEVNFGKEKSDSIVVHFNDHADDLAAEFVRKHGLKSTGKSFLSPLTMKCSCFVVFFSVLLLPISLYDLSLANIPHSYVLPTWASININVNVPPSCTTCGQVHTRYHTRI